MACERTKMAWILDLDGVVWLAHRPIAGAPEAVAHLRARGHRVLFATNFSYSPRSELEEALAAAGIDPGDDVVTSAMAAAAAVPAGSAVHVCGGPGIVEAVEEAGSEVVPAGAPADAVIVGYDPDFDYARLDAAFQAVRRGARLIGTNDDATYPRPEGPTPGGGAMVAAVAYASGVEAHFGGKPHELMAGLVRDRLAADPGRPPPGAVSEVMVGDRPSTDGRFAHRLGVPFGLVLSGVTGVDDLPTDPVADHVADDLASLVDRHG